MVSPSLSHRESPSLRSLSSGKDSAFAEQVDVRPWAPLPADPKGSPAWHGHVQQDEIDGARMKRKDRVVRLRKVLENVLHEASGVISISDLQSFSTNAYIKYVVAQKLQVLPRE